MRTASSSLLADADPPPVELIRTNGEAPLVLTCEHGGNAVPKALADNIPPASDMARHIAFDVGAAAVAKGLADRLDAVLALQPFSRLVIDCNRPRHAADLAPAFSDGSAIAFNQGLGDDDLEARWQAIHQPYHQAVAKLIRACGRPALVAVHSFTRQLHDQPPRPMELGLIARQDRRFAQALGTALVDREPHLRVAYDAPYRIEDSSDYTIPTHGETLGLPHLLLEIRNDLITDAHGIAAMVDRLAAALDLALVEVEAESSNDGLR